MATISVIPTVEMVEYINDKFSPDYDICGGAGNLGFCLGIPTSDSHFRLDNPEFDKFSSLHLFIVIFRCLSTWLSLTFIYR